jgi:hypothetical protein
MVPSRSFVKLLLMLHYQQTHSKIDTEICVTIVILGRIPG